MASVICGRATWLALLAQGRLDDLSSGLRRRGGGYDTGEIMMWVALVVAVIAGIWGLSKLAAQRDSRRPSNSPRRLFAELCRAHELDRRQRKLLRQIVRWQRLAHPARVFLDPERFDAANLNRPLQAQQAAVTAMRTRLFGKLDDAE